MEQDLDEEVAQERFLNFVVSHERNNSVFLGCGNNMEGTNDMERKGKWQSS